MEITARQFGQLEAAAIALEEATEKNNTALKLVNVIKDNLTEISKTAYPFELVLEFDQPEQPLNDVAPAADCPMEDSPVEHADIKAYGQELIESGAGIKELIKLVMEHFNMPQDAFAHLIHVNQGSLSKYLRNGERRDAVITGVADFFGEDCAAIKEKN